MRSDSFSRSCRLWKAFQNSQAAKGFIPGLDVHVIDTDSVSAGGFFVGEKGVDKAIQRMADASFKSLSSRPHMVKIFKAYGLDHNKSYIDQAFDRLMAGLPLISITDYQVFSGRGWPTVTCHSGPEVFALSVYGEPHPV